MNQVKYLLTPGRRLALFACLTVMCYVITSLIVGFITLKWGMDVRPMRIAAVLQDLLLFILPAIVTAVLITRLPATFLLVDRRPGIARIIIGIMTMFVALAPMNVIIRWNASLHLPQSMAALEQALRTAENVAAQSVNVLLGDGSTGSLVVSILIVGVLAGFSEELFFRGTLQRLLSGMHINIHVAIWLTAVIFAGVHFQFFGFVPRMLLGAFFGYALYWSQSLWLPVILHITNNTVYIVSQWAGEQADMDSLGAGNPWGVLFMTAITAICLIWLWRKRPHKS